MNMSSDITPEQLYEYQREKFPKINTNSEQTESTPKKIFNKMNIKLPAQLQNKMILNMIGLVCVILLLILFGVTTSGGTRIGGIVLTLVLSVIGVLSNTVTKPQTTT